MLTIAIALLGAVAYGAADFFGGLASRTTTTLAVVVWSQAAGFLVLAIALPLLPGSPHWNDLAWGALCGVFGAGGVALLYRGLAIGAMGVVSPITAVLAAALPVFYGTVRNAPPSPLAGAGIALALAAVVLLAWSPPAAGERARRGLIEAVGSGVLIGVFLIVIAQSRPAAGLWPLVGARSASVVVFALAGALLRMPLRPARAALGLILAGGLCDMLANVLYVVAARGGQLAIVAVLISLYPGATVALAAGVLREHLRGTQWIGVGIALASVALISAGR